MMRQLFFPCTTRHCGALAALLAVHLGFVAFAAAEDPLVEFQQVLAGRSPDREQTLAKLIDTQLKTLGQMRRGLMLDDWNDRIDKEGKPAGDPELAPVDIRLRARIGDRFRARVRRIVESGDDDSKAAVANLITEMGLTVRAAVPPDPAGKKTPEQIDAERRAGFARTMTPDMIRLSQSSSDFVRMHALRALGGMNPDPIPAARTLAAQLVPGTPVPVRRVAADSLLRLITVANYLKEESMRGRAVKATLFDVLIADDAVARYAPTGLVDADPVVRERCAEALHAGAHALGGVLQQPVYQQPRKVGRQLSDIVNTFPREEVDKLKEVLAAYAAAEPRLVKSLRDPSAEVRVAVVGTLEQLSDARYRLGKDKINIGTPEKIEERIFLKPPEAADPLGILAKGDWRRVAQLMLNDPDARVRRAAVNFLEYFPEARPAVVGDLTRALCDPDRFVRWSAARGLGYFTKDYQPRDAVPAVPALAKMLFDPDFTDRLAAAATLEALGPYAEAAVPDLARAVHYGDVENRVAALYIIQSIGPARSKALIPAVTEALKQDDARVRRTAAETLGRYGSLARDPGTIAALRRAMGDDDQEVRINASEALLEILGNDPPTKQY